MSRRRRRASGPRRGWTPRGRPPAGPRNRIRFRMRRLTLAACLLSVAATLGLAACGDEEPGVDEPAREGLALELDGVTYNVFITRQLNPRVTPDQAYVTEEAPPGDTLYGVFIQVCNHSDEPQETISEFVGLDTQDNRFGPEEI